MAMAEPQIRFVDGAGYERMMGVWSRSAGEVFLDWLAPPRGLAWADIGCGNGAFTELLVDSVAPAKIFGIDPSPQQLTFARQRHTAGLAEFTQGDALALPFANASVDAAIMALVLFFVPDPAKGVAEMMRVVRPGGIVAAYVWDFPGGGFPWEVVQAELRAAGAKVPWPPQAAVSRLEALHQLWVDSGLVSVMSRDIVVERTFSSFDEFWEISLLTPTMGSIFATLSAPAAASVKERVRAALRIEGGQVVHSARASAVKGVVPS
jgi:ubiquinone/menaquinone biosynthesis C-methylase UbiE